MKKIVLALCCAGAASSSFALQEPMNITAEKLTADINYLLSQSSATGTTDKETQSLSGKINYERKHGEWGQSYSLEGVNSRSKNSPADSIERYLGFAQGMRYLNGAEHYLFTKLQIEKDLSSAYDYILSPTFGYGRTLLKDQRQSLVAEAGIGGQYLKNRGGGSDFEGLATLAAEYRLKVNEAVNFEQDISFEFAESLRTLRSRTAVIAKLSDKISGQVSYDLKDADGSTLDTKDSLISVGLRYTH